MPLLLQILFFNFIGSFVSLIGGVLLLFKADFTKKITPLLVAFAAGTMLSASFFDLLPEALEFAEDIQVPINIILLTVLGGMVTFFLIERFILWSHHHHGDVGEETHPTIPLLIVGDSLHNFLDGVTVAVTFIASVPLGIITSLVVGAHEIPQEIGDFATLLHQGLSRKKVLLVNVISALISFLGALTAFFLLQHIRQLIPFMLAFATGNFLYIASSDLIPEIHRVYKKENAIKQTAFFLIGISVTILAISLLEQ